MSSTLMNCSGPSVVLLLSVVLLPDEEGEGVVVLTAREIVEKYLQISCVAGKMPILR